MKEIHIQSPKSIVYLTTLPFILLTLAVLVTDSANAYVFTNPLIFYTAIFNTFIIGFFRVLDLRAPNNGSELLDPKLIALSLVGIVVSWSTILLSDSILSFLLAIAIQVCLLIVHYKAIPTPSFMSNMKILPLHISLACLVISGLRSLAF